jgi:AraC-like DNA-binding protein
MNTLQARLEAVGHQARGLVFPHRVVPLHAMLTSCGYQRETQPSYDWHGLKRGKTELVVLQYTLSGHGLLTYEGRASNVEPGTLMLVHIPHDHRYRVPDSSSGWEFLYVCVTGMEALRLCKHLEHAAGPLLRIPFQSRSLDVMVTLYEQAVAGQITNAFDGSALAYRLIMALLSEFLSVQRAGEKPEFVARVEAYCKTRVGDPIAVQDMARVARFSRYHFSRQFKAHTGAAPARYLNGIRVREAARLLRETDLSLKEVADRCGFTDGHYFGKVFARVIGVTPGVYRRRGG